MTASGGLLCASLLAVFSICWSIPFPANVEGQQLLRDTRSAESPFLSTVQDGRHRSVKKAGAPAANEHLHRVNKRASVPLLDVEKQLQALLLPSAAAAAAAAVVTPGTSLTPEEELKQLAKSISKSPNAAEPEQVPVQLPSQVADKWKESYVQWIKNKEKLRESWPRSRYPASAKNADRKREMNEPAQGQGVLSKAEKRSVYKKMKKEEEGAILQNSLPPESWKAFYRANQESKQIPKVANNNERVNKKKSVTAPKIAHRLLTTKRRQKSKLLSKTVRMRRSLVHLASENSMSQTQRRKRRKKRNVEEEDVYEYEPHQLEAIRDLLEQRNDAYYAENGPDSDSRDESRKRDDMAQEKKQKEEEKEEEEERLQEALEAEKKLENKMAPPLVMFLINHKEEKGLFIPLDQESARKQAFLLAETELEEEAEKKEKERLFALANLLSPPGDEEVEEEGTPEVDVDKRIPIGYPGIGYSMVEKKRFGPMEYAEYQELEDPRMGGMQDNSEDLAHYLNGEDEDEKK